MTVRGLLLDLEGVLYLEDQVLVGAPEAIRALGESGLVLRFLTNTTTRPRRAIVSHLQNLGFTVALEQVFTPARAANHLLAQEGVQRVHLAAPPALAEDFDAFELTDAQPDAIILGDLHTDFTWNRLDGLFRMLLDGARLVALHKNRYCRRGADLALDLGPFVAALEYAANIEAFLVGKPSKAFFLNAVTDMGLSPSEVVMVGDDIEADIGGALNAGLRAVQVETGKYRPADESHSAVRASGRIASIAALPQWLKMENG